MKTKLYKKWLKKCKRFDKENYEKYASALGDNFLKSI